MSEQPTETTPIRVSFAASKWQNVSLEVASMMLTLWHSKQPAQFGAYLAEVMTGTPPNGRKARP
jgi:hypothetical protein